jgi:hypothetical protein
VYSACVALSLNGKGPFSVSEFWSLFWGTIPVVTDDAVGAVVNEFHIAISDQKNDSVALRNLSMKLAHAVRTSLEFDKYS